MIAARRGHTAVVGALLERHAELQPFKDYLNLTTSDGRTALHLALQSGSTEIARALLDAGADADQKDTRGKTALDYASDATREALTKGSEK